ncbi:MAG: hypothetical protein AAF357_11090, partial [Verrucomicrobiota bacterium]
TSRGPREKSLLEFLASDITQVFSQEQGRQDEAVTIAESRESLDEKRSVLSSLSSRLERLRSLHILQKLKGEELSADDFNGFVPFKMLKNEFPIWQQDEVVLCKYIKQRQTKGQSLGMSLRVAKGVYLRPSSFSAKPETTEHLEEVDEGTVTLTNKHIAFDGNKEHLKIRLTSLALIHPYSDSIELQKNTQTARPFYLYPLDGWFFYNVIQFV